VSGTGLIQATPVKDAIEAYSGRFEFFKQALTLGSAGLAGMAALFTDPTRVPTDIIAKVLAVLSGASLLFMVAWAAMGISSYGNLLTSIARKAGFSFAPKPTHPKEPEFFARGVTQHARVIIVALGCAWIFLSAFALYKIWAPGTISVDIALSNIKGTLSKEAGIDPSLIPLERLDEDAQYYIATYRIGTDTVRVRATKTNGTIHDIVHDRLPSAGVQKP
jgi:hypothetical protein